ncbi:hypothetical protein [Hyphomonas sp.]|jgi:hypothetical protein|uniref:hypothetical protein n=1 Tax=Hyphomonas sp. TaxID=87 RepID=UPI003567CF3E
MILRLTSDEQVISLVGALAHAIWGTTGKSRWSQRAERWLVSSSLVGVIPVIALNKCCVAFWRVADTVSFSAG